MRNRFELWTLAWVSVVTVSYIHKMLYIARKEYFLGDGKHILVEEYINWHKSKNLKYPVCPPGEMERLKDNLFNSATKVFLNQKLFLPQWSKLYLLWDCESHTCKGRCYGWRRIRINIIFNWMLGTINAS